MTGERRRELLMLIDLLCEGAASRQQCARLEELVLADPEARRTYLDTMEMHGLLTWDAGVAAGGPHAAPMPVSPASRQARLPGEGPRRRIAAAGAATLLLVLLSVLYVVSPPLAQRRQREQAGPNRPAPSEEHRAPQNGVRPVELPVAQQARVEPAESRTSRTQQSAPPAQLLQDYSDAGVVSFINGQIEAGWRDAGIRPAARAEDAEWVRRIHLDLAGRIPRPEETVAFLAEPSAADKDRYLIGSLLESPDHHRHMATVWMNLLVGRSEDRDISRPELFAYLVDQFREGRPWTETVGELIAARGTASENGATNFLLAHLNNQAVPATAIVSRLFLGQQLQCTQCHQHPQVKEWGQERFWEFNAFFQQCKAVTRTAVDRETGETLRYRELVDRPIGGPTYYENLQGLMKVSYPKFAGVEIDPEKDVSRRQALVELMCSGDDPQLARAFVNRMWEQFFGYGLTPIVDDMGPHNPPSHPQLLDGLAEAFIASGYDVQRLVKWICLSVPYRLSSRPGEGNASDRPERGAVPLFSRMYLKPMTVEQLYDSLVVAAGLPAAQRLQDDLLDPEREEFVQQFFTSVETEENGESSTFDGSLRQALLMINGPEVHSALNVERDTLLAEILASPESETEKIRRLCLVTLSRYPTAEELSAVRQVLRRHVKSRTERNVPPRVAVAEGLRDLYWAYLNSSEFSTNH